MHNSPQNEAISSAIMEVSGELMLGKFSSQKQQSGGSESSDISDDDRGRAMSRGSIAKYPESSTGLSDNDWNPYATESDTNQTPRSPRSNNSDDQSRGGYVSKATFNIGGAGKQKETVSSNKVRENIEGRNSGNGSDRLDILRFVMDGDKAQEMNTGSGRFSEDSTTDTFVRESVESRTETGSGTVSGRPSSDFDRDVYVRESVDSARSIHSDGTGAQSGRQSVESGRSSRSDVSAESGQQSERSQKSDQSHVSAQSKHSEKSTGRSGGSDRSDRLDQLNDAAGGNIKNLIEFESAQRYRAVDSQGTSEEDGLSGPKQSESTGDIVARTRLSARVESYGSPIRSARSPEHSPTIVRNAGGYVSVAERERLLSDSPELTNLLPRFTAELQSEQRPRLVDNQSEVSRPTASQKVSHSISERSPSEASMRRVTDLFEETKRQAREAVAVQRPDPSGSEERFPLRERMTISKHDDSFKQQDRSTGSDGRLEKSRDSEAARSMNSEEVARVLGRCHVEEETIQPQRKNENANSRLISAFDNVDNVRQGRGQELNSVRRNVATSDEESEEISQRVQALLARTDQFSAKTGTITRPRGDPEYVPNTIDYSRLQRDLQEIQDSLHDVPVPVANDSMYLQRRDRAETDVTDKSHRDEYMKSLEVTRTTVGGRDSGISEYGRESGVSEYGKKLVWDYGADLQYEKGYGGQFIGKTLSKDAALQRGRESADTLTSRTSPEMADDTDVDITSVQRSRPISQTDLTRAEKIVDQVMSRRAEGDLKESVEDIIARYRNERRDLFDRLQAPPEPSIAQTSRLDQVPRQTNESKKAVSVLKDPSIALSVLTPTGDASQPKNGKKQPGLAERVYKILRDEETEESDNPDERGMAKKVYKILASDRPDDQVNGILAKTMAEENEALKQLVSKPKEDSSLEESALNETADSYDLGDQDVKKQLEYSLFSSPGKGDRSELAALREVTSAPYSALSNAKSLLSSQLQKMTMRNFDKSVELRTPYRQTIDCYPVYGVERRAASERQTDQLEPREAWTPASRPTQPQSTSSRALGK